MSSPTSTSVSNPIPGTSGKAIAPIAAAAQNPVLQIDQKKVPVFCAELDKDSLTVIHWCARIDGMKETLGWSDEATYANASAALFGITQRTAANWAILYKDNHRKTWTYLKKKMLSHFGNISGSRAFMDSMFSIRQRTNTYENLDKFNADVVDAFQVVRQILPPPDAPPGGCPQRSGPQRRRSSLQEEKFQPRHLQHPQPGSIRSCPRRQAKITKAMYLLPEDGARARRLLLPEEGQGPVPHNQR